MAELNARILLPADQEMLLSFARARLEGDEMTREMASWDARWRAEALEHYLPQGWSFGVFRGDKIAGFVLAQPYLFHRGLMQTLWVETLVSESSEVSRLLLDTVYRWARDKHLQCVLLEESFAREWPEATPVGEGLMEIKTARFKR